MVSLLHWTVYTASSALRLHAHCCRADHIKLEDVKAEYATGKSVVHDKLDKYGRPVLVIKACKHNSGVYRSFEKNYPTAFV